MQIVFALLPSMAIWIIVNSKEKIGQSIFQSLTQKLDEEL